MTNQFVLRGPLFEKEVEQGGGDSAEDTIFSGLKGLASKKDQSTEIDEEKPESRPAKKKKSSIKPEDSSLLAGLEGLRGKKEEPSEEDKDEGEPEEETGGDEEEEPEENKDEAEGDESDIDLSKIKNKDGSDISLTSAQAFTKFKSKIKELSSENETLRKSVEESAEFVKLKKERDELKSVVEAKYLTSDPDFKRKYDKPIDIAKKKAENYVSSVPDREQGAAIAVLGDISKLLSPSSILEEDTEMKVVGLIDKIAETMSPTAGRKFGEAMVDWYDAEKSRTAALQASESTRQGLESESVGRAEQLTEKSSKVVTQSFEAWQLRNEDRLSYYRDSEEIGFDDESDDRLEVVEKGIAHIIKTGEMPKSLADLIVDGGVVGQSLKKSEESLAKAFRASVDKISLLEAEKKKLEEQIADLSGEDYGDSSSSDDEDDDEGSLGSALLSQLKKLRKE